MLGSKLFDIPSYDIDLIRHERSVIGVISNDTSTVLTDIAPLILLISHVFKSPCLTNNERLPLKFLTYSCIYHGLLSDCYR